MKISRRVSETRITIQMYSNVSESDIVVIILIQTKNQKQKSEKNQKTNSMNVFQEHVSKSKNNQIQTS